MQGLAFCFVVEGAILVVVTRIVSFSSRFDVGFGPNTQSVDFTYIDWQQGWDFSRCFSFMALYAQLRRVLQEF